MIFLVVIRHKKYKNATNNYLIAAVIYGGALSGRQQSFNLRALLSCLLGFLARCAWLLSYCVVIRVVAFRLLTTTVMMIDLPASYGDQTRGGLKTQAAPCEPTELGFNPFYAELVYP